MTWVLVSAVLGIAVVDSINPSALAMTAYLLLTSDAAPKVRAYIAAIFATYLALGLFVVLVLGDGVRALVDALDRPGVGFALSGLIGAVALAFAIRPRRRRITGERRPRPLVATPRRAFVLGITITAVESTTALPYLGALAAIVRADLAVWQQIILLGAYCAVFVIPPLVLVALVRRGRADVTDRFRSMFERRGRPGRGDAVVRGLCAVVGSGLVVDSALFFLRGDPLF